MTRRLTPLAGLALLILGLLILAALWWGHWIGPRSAHIRVLDQARLETGEAVRLPHHWQDKRPTGQAYTLELPPTDAPTGVLIVDAFPGLRFALDGKAWQPEEYTGRWNQAVALTVPAGAQQITVQVPQHFSLSNGLDKVRIGPAELIQRQGLQLSFIRAFANNLSSGLLLGIGILSVIGWVLHPVPILGVLGGTAFIACLQQGQLSLLGLWRGDDLMLATWTATGVGTVLAVSLLILVAAGRPWRRFFLAELAVGAVVGVILLGQLGSIELRRVLLNVGALPLFFWAMYVAGPVIWARRDWVLLTVSVTLGAQWALRVYTLIVHDGQLTYAGINNAQLLAPMLSVIIGVSIAERLYRVFLRHQRLNESLQVEVEAARSELAAANQREQALAVQQAAQAERVHWMQEIHDGLGSQLMASRLLAGKLPEQPAIREIQSAMDEAIDQLRMMVEALSPTAQSAPSLLGSVRYRLMPRLAALGLTMRWDVDETLDARELPPRDALNVQRIVQEALTNILKHARATEIRVSIQPVDGWLRVRIEDDGVGLEAMSRSTGKGLDNMRRRAQECRGRLEISPLAQGARLDLLLPND